MIFTFERIQMENRPTTPTQFSEARKRLASQGVLTSRPTNVEQSLSKLGERGQTYKSKMLAGRKRKTRKLRKMRKSRRVSRRRL